MGMELRLGFPNVTLESAARRLALEEWREAHERAGRETPPGEPALTVVRDDPERVKLGEYLIIVSGGGADNSGDDQ